MKKIIALLLTIIMLLSFTACANLQSESSGQTTSEKPPNESSTDKTEGNNNVENITITIAEHVANIETQSPHVAAIVKAFQDQNPEIVIKMTGTEKSEHITKMKMAAQSGALPDIIWLEAPTAREMVAAGYLADLTPFIEERGMKDYFLPGMLSVVEVDNKYYGFPSETLACGLWYNKAIFSEYNIEVPETYEEYLDTIKTFKSNDVITISKGAMSNFSVWSFQAMLARYGFFEKYDALMSGEESWVNDDFIKFYEKVKEMTEVGAFPENVTTLDYFQAVEMFMGGQAAMVDAGAWETSKFEQSDIASDIGFVWGPTFSDGVGEQKIGIKAPGGPYCVSADAAKDSAKMEAVMDFFDFFYGPEGTQIVVDNMILPTTKFDGNIDEAKYPVFNAMLSALNDDYQGVAEPFAQLPPETGEALFESIYGVINEVYTPEEAAQLVEDALSRER